MIDGADGAAPARVLRWVPPNGRSFDQLFGSTPDPITFRRPEARFPRTTRREHTGQRLATSKGVPFMAYEPHGHEPAPVDPDRGSLAGYAAIKYTAIVIVVLAIIAFLAWVIIRFTG